MHLVTQWCPRTFLGCSCCHHEANLPMDFIRQQCIQVHGSAAFGKFVTWLGSAGNVALRQEILSSVASRYQLSSVPRGRNGSPNKRHRIGCRTAELAAFNGICSLCSLKSTQDAYFSLYYLLYPLYSLLRIKLFLQTPTFQEAQCAHTPTVNG